MQPFSAAYFWESDKVLSGLMESSKSREGDLLILVMQVLDMGFEVACCFTCPSNLHILCINGR